MKLIIEISNKIIINITKFNIQTDGEYLIKFGNYFNKFKSQFIQLLFNNNWYRISHSNYTKHQT